MIAQLAPGLAEDPRHDLAVRVAPFLRGFALGVKQRGEGRDHGREPFDLALALGSAPSMTWVIGFPSIAGYAGALADIQVTFADRQGVTQYVDGLQKVHAVGQWVLAGFCGNVRIGFRLVDDLRAWLAFPPDESNRAWYPEFVALKWRRRARRIYAALAPQYPGGSALVLAATHPTRNTGWADSPASYACVMEAPEFHPRRIRDNSVESIGSGNNVEKYREELRGWNSDPTHLVRSDLFMSPGDSARSLAHALALRVAGTPSPGVSRFFRVGIVRRGSITIENNDYEVIHHGGRREVFRSPPCAADWESLQDLLRRNGAAGLEQAAIA